MSKRKMGMSKSALVWMLIQAKIIAYKLGRRPKTVNFKVSSPQAKVNFFLNITYISVHQIKQVRRICSY